MLRLIGFAFTAGLALAIGAAAAGQEPPTTPAPDENLSPTPTKEEILASNRWRRVTHEFNEWLSVQHIYDAQRVAEIKKEFQTRVAKMTAEQLDDMLDDMEAKLKILFSPEAEEARNWLAQFLSVQAIYTPEQLQKMLPDVVTMNAAQLQDELQRFEQERMQVRQRQQAFDAQRQREVDQVRQMQLQAQQAQAQAMARAGQVQPPGGQKNLFSTPYAPRRIDYNVPAPPRFWITPWGGVNRILPW